MSAKYAGKSWKWVRHLYSTCTRLLSECCLKIFTPDDTYRYSKIVNTSNFETVRKLHSNDKAHLIFSVQNASSATSNDRRSESWECNLEGSKWKLSEQVREILQCVKFAIMSWIMNFEVAYYDLCLFFFVVTSSAFDAERERQHRAKYRQMEVTTRE